MTDFFKNLRILGGLYGVLMILVGLLALATPLASTLAAVFVIGLSLVVGGIFGLIAAFTERRGGAAWATGLWAALAIALGAWLLVQPGLGAVSLTLALGLVVVVRGLTSLFVAFDPLFKPARLWLILGGLVGIVLGGIILFNLYAVAGVTLGVIIGIDFLFYGLALLFGALAGRPAIR